MHACIHPSIHPSTHPHIHTSTYTYTHTHTHIYIPFMEVCLSLACRHDCYVLHVDSVLVPSTERGSRATAASWWPSHSSILPAFDNIPQTFLRYPDIWMHSYHALSSYLKAVRAERLKKPQSINILLQTAVSISFPHTYFIINLNISCNNSIMGNVF